MSMTYASQFAVYGIAQFVLLGAFLIIVTKMWRPEVPFGVSVPSAGTEEVRKRALRFWTKSVGALTIVMIAVILLIARLEPKIWFIHCLIIPYFVLGGFFYTRARKMLLPLATQAKKVSAIFSRRNFWR